MQSQQPMSFAQSYILALKVRSKLTKQASDPKTSLRALVTQANMLDNLMDHIATETTKRNQKMNSVVVEDSDVVRRERNVTISRPDRREQNTSIAEYEVDSDSDSDFDSESDSDSDYYYSSEEEADEEDISEDESEQLQQLTNIRRSSRETSMVSQVFPSRETQTTHTAPLSVIVEEMAIEEDADEEEEKDENDVNVETHGLPGLCRSHSLTDEEDFEQSNYVLETTTTEHYTPRYMDAKTMKVDQVHIHDDVHTHHRSNAMVPGVY